MERCPTCSADIPAGNLTLHSLRCPGARNSAYTTATPPVAPNAPSTTPQMTAAAASPEPMDVDESNGETWNCTTCTLTNAVDDRLCMACGTMREISAIPSSSGAHSTAAIGPAPPLPTRADVWVCTACTLENPLGDTQCRACGTPGNARAPASGGARISQRAFTRPSQRVQRVASHLTSRQDARARRSDALQRSMQDVFQTMFAGTDRVHALPGLTHLPAELEDIVQGVHRPLTSEQQMQPGSFRSASEALQALEANNAALQQQHQSISALLQQAGHIMQAFGHMEGMQSPARRDRPAQPAAQNVLDALPTHAVTTEELAAAPEENRSCCICLSDFEEGEEQRVLPCFHRFHRSCVDTWLHRNGSCPICKHSVNVNDTSSTS